MWCVDSQSPFYNSYIEGFKNLNVKSFRDDSLYDIFINLNYNIYPTKNLEEVQSSCIAAIQKQNLLKVV